MAPQIRSSATNNSGTGTSSTVSVTLPSNVSDGDVGYLSVTMNTATDRGDVSGWELIDFTVSSTLIQQKVYRKTLSASDASSNVSWTLSNAQKWGIVATIVQYDGGIDVEGTADPDTGTFTTFDYDAITPVADDDLLLGFRVWRVATTGTTTGAAPTNWTEVNETSTNAATSPTLGVGVDRLYLTDGGGASQGPWTDGSYAETVTNRISQVIAVKDGRVYAGAAAGTGTANNATVATSSSSGDVTPPAATGTGTANDAIVDTQASVTYYFQEDYEGTPGATMTSTNTEYELFNGAGTSTLESTPTPLYGTTLGEYNGGQVLTKDTDSLPGTTNGGSALRKIYFRGYFHVDSASNLTLSRIIVFESSVSTGGTDIGVLRINADGSFRMLDGTTTVGTVSTHTIGTDRTRIELFLNQDDNQITYRLWWGADLQSTDTGATNYETQTATLSTNTDIEVFGVGFYATQATNHSLYVEEVAVGTGGWLGPIPTSVDASPTAGVASGTGTANNATVKVSPPAGAASGTGAGTASTVGVRVSAGVAAASGTANQATSWVDETGNATTATGSAPAQGVTASIFVYPEDAEDPPSGEGHPGNATGFGVANPPNLSISQPGPATAATATGAANTPTRAVKVSAGVAVGTGVAHPASLSLAAAAPAGSAAATGTANTTTSGVKASAQSLTKTGTANQPTVTKVEVKNVAAVPATAGVEEMGDPAAAIKVSAGAAAGTGTAYTVVPIQSAPAGVATATGVAHQPSIQTNNAANATADDATGTGTAYNATVSVTTTARPGAVWASEANRVPNPSFEGTVTEYTVADGGPTGYFSFPYAPDTTPEPWEGEQYLSGVTNSASNVQGLIVFAPAASVVKAGTVVQCEIVIMFPAGVTWSVSGRYNDPTGAYLGEAGGIITGTGTGSWQRVRTAPWTHNADFIPGVQARTTTAATGRYLAFDSAKVWVVSQAAAKVAPPAGSASGTGAAYGATVKVAPTAQSGTSTAVAQQVTSKITVTPTTATAAATAHQPTVTKSEVINRTPATATATAVAHQPTVTVSEVKQVTPTTATGTGVAYNATVSLAEAKNVTPVTATGTGTAHNAAASVKAPATAGTGTAPAQGVTAGVKASAQAATAAAVAVAPYRNTSAPAQVATATGVAHQPSIQMSGATNATADDANATGTAYNPTISVSASAGAASGTGTANGATGTVKATAGPANALATPKVNLAPPFNQWGLIGNDLSVDGDGVATFTTVDNGAYLTTKVYVGGATSSIFFSVEVLNSAAASPDVPAWGPNEAGWIGSQFYYGPDGVTPALNSAGYYNNGQARKNFAGVGNWGTPDVMGSQLTGPNIHWVEITWRHQATYSGTGTVQYRNPVISVTNLAPSGSNWPTVGSGTGQQNVQVSAGLASATGTAHQPTAAVARSAPAGAAAGTGVANGVTAGVRPTPQTATGTGAANQPTAQTTGQANVFPGAAAGAGTAQNPSGAVKATIIDEMGAWASAQAFSPTTQVKVQAGVASATGTAHTPSVSTSGATNATADDANATGTAHNPTVSISQPTNVTPTTATASGVAHQPLISTAGQTFAQAGTANGSGAASGVSAALKPVGGVALAAAAEAQASIALGIPSGVGTGTGTSNNPRPGVGAAPDTALALGTAGDLLTALAVAAQCAVGTGIALDPDVITTKVTLQVIVPPTAYKVWVERLLDGPPTTERVIITATVVPTSLRRLVTQTGDAVSYETVELVEGDVLTLAFHLKYRDVNGVEQVFDLTGYSGLTLRVKQRYNQADGDAFFTGTGSIIGLPTAGVVEVPITSAATVPGRFWYALKGTKSGNPRTLAHGDWVITNV